MAADTPVDVEVGAGGGGAMAYALKDIRTQLAIGVSVPLFLVGLFVICFFLHGELYARRPERPA